ncbi:6-phosphofructokinase 2 [Paraburkholderia diazotrophica]|uniref:6-phosphofructokinase 2 n=1 Tax=Paraburkholderia diazotrophica TaxID=667676 RepID=A0A1H7D9N7_9BURK|nr:6-phosphofructokinase 2 [Paraburkholderia diazotrophica]
MPLPDADSQADAARALIADGKARMVALTLAENGVLLTTRDETYCMPALKTEVRSAIGAGDSFLAGMLWALDQGAVPREALGYGTAAAAATMKQPGTRLCDARDVARAYVTENRLSPRKPPDPGTRFLATGGASCSHKGTSRICGPTFRLPCRRTA